jgi:hypothetical protein
VFHLDHGGTRVGKRVQKSQSLIGRLDGLVEFLDLEFVFLMLLFSDEGVLSKGLAVEVHVVVDLADAVLDLITTGDEELVDGVVHAGNIGLSIADVLFKGNNNGVVLVSAGLEVELQLLEVGVQVFDQFFDGGKEFIDWAFHSGMKLHQVQQSLAEAS